MGMRNVCIPAKGGTLEEGGNPRGGRSRESEFGSEEAKELRMNKCESGE